MRESVTESERECDREWHRALGDRVLESDREWQRVLEIWYRVIESDRE